MINFDNIASLTQTHVTGGNFRVGDYNEDILEYRDGDGWSKIGTMRDARNYHATSIIEFKEFEEYCN